MKEIKFVDVGEGITEGHIRKWLVADGATVKEDQSLLQVETDKAVVNVPAPIDGVLRIVAKEGTTVKVGDSIAFVGAKDEVSGAQPAQAAMPQALQQKAKAAPAAPQQTAPIQKEILATPYVRKLARDLKVELPTITGTGPEGRILENDVRNHVASTAPPKPVPKFSETLEEEHKEDIERIPLTTVRKAIAKNMEASLSVPCASHMDLIDASHLFDIVGTEKPKVAKEKNIHLTFLPFIIKAVIEALKEYPNFNASYDHESLEIIRKNYYNIGLAAESPSGLKVVVIKDADKKGVLKLAKEIQQLGDKVKNETITLDEMKDSTFTITNIGSLGGGFMAVPIINHPDVAILGIMRIRDWAFVKDGKVVPGKMLPFSIVFDHRVNDGAEAVAFGNSLIKYLEDPEFLEML